MNAPDGNTIATTEHTFAMMLALSRFIPQAYNSMRDGQWDRKTFIGTELRDKTLGIIGFGRIGRALATRAQAFEMTVVAHDPYVTQDVASAMNVKLLSLDELYAQSDYISLHALVTDETRGMINAQSIASMKAGVRIVNVARGNLINDADLAAGIQSGKVAGAAVDVYAKEPPPADHPLLGLDGVIHTPHLGASTIEAQNEVAVQAAQNLLNALLKGEYSNVVNPAVLEKR
jgi:D-3-phosphoglycerate dehydrogenase